MRLIAGLLAILAAFLLGCHYANEGWRYYGHGQWPWDKDECSPKEEAKGNP